MEHVDIGIREDVRTAAQAILVCRRDELEIFNRVFDAYWNLSREQPVPDDRWEIPAANDPDEQSAEARSRKMLLSLLAGDHPGGKAGLDNDAQTTGYSDQDILMRKDLDKLNESEVKQARELMAKLIRALLNRPGRRYRPAHTGKVIDIHRSFRADVPRGLAGLEFKYRRRRINKLKLMLLCDVSGSMKPYSEFLLEFIYALRKELPRVEAAVFSTHMTPVTRHLETPDIQQSINGVSRGVWGGGTNIGQSLAEFYDLYSNEMHHSRTVMIILSDGWDRGDAHAMQREIARLRRRIFKLIWLNPLLGSKDYQPLCRGIRCALPYMDHFMPAHNLTSLARFVELLRGSLSTLPPDNPGSRLIN